MLVLNIIFLLSLCFWVTSIDYFGGLSINLGSLISNNFDISFELGEFNVYIFLMLIVCSNISLIFNFHYYSGYHYDSISLSNLLVFFIMVMFLLVGTSNLFSSLVFWEYLGLVSFLLVSFYDSSSSLRGGIITLVSSRFGDVAFFLLLSLYYIGGGVGVVIYILCWVIISTKSACFPFGSWLLEAMRAPTPVSSLVHSSTLVAAGVWFLSCYYDVLFFSGFYIFMISCCVVTVVCSGLSALVNNDIKQVVALSTCNNISWIILIGLHGDIGLCIFQLMIHAISKCLLFVYVGDYIISSGGGQFLSNVNLGYYSNFFLVYLLVILLGLSGLPFIGLYFSKHLFLYVLCGYNFLNIFLVVIVWLMLSLTFAYCFRLFLFFFNRELFFLGGYRVSFVAGWLVLLSIGFYTVAWVYDIEACRVGYLFTIFTFFSIFIGLLLCIYSFVGWWGGCWRRYLFGQDLLVQLFEFFLLFICNISVLSVFRWESFFLSYINRILCTGTFSIYFSMNILFIGSLLLFVYFLI